MTSVVNIQTARLYCRPPTPSDVSAVFSIFSDVRTTELTPLPPLVSTDQATKLVGAWSIHWEKFRIGTWCISLAGTPDELIGFGGISIRDFSGEQLPNLWYRLTPRAWGNGYATEFSTAAVNYALVEAGLKEIHALVKPEHSASIRVLEKIGMTRNGLEPIPGSKEASLRFKLNPQSANPIIV